MTSGVAPSPVTVLVEFPGEHTADVTVSPEVDVALAALAAALWPFTIDGPLVLGISSAGSRLDVELTAADGSLPLGEVARVLRQRQPRAGVSGGAVAGSDTPGTVAAELNLDAHGVRLVVNDPSRDAYLLASRVTDAARMLVAHPGQPIDEMPPSGAEHDRLRTWIGAPVRYADMTSVDGAVAAIAMRQPGRVALRQGDAAVTYRELLDHADRLASGLRRHGVVPGSVVVLRLPRGFDLVAAMLAILRCGAAYCAVEERWPAARVHDVLVDTASPLLVGAAPDGYLGGVAVMSPVDVVSDALFEPTTPRHLDDGFCVYFTSGSTGRPKGVLSTHRGTLRTLANPRHPRLDDGVVTLAAAPLPWDAFTLELWSALLHGGSCVLPEQSHLTPAELRHAVAAGVNTVWLTASLFNVLVDEDAAAFTGLAQVLTGGERLSVAHVARFRHHHPGITLVNGYGPVEATVFVTTHEIIDADLDAYGGIPIGRPMPGTEALVVRTTSTGRLVRAAIGEPGEICAAGDGLAAGYLGAAAGDNTDRFPVLRLAGEPPLRVYRTGDIGVWRSDGVLLFRGRADRQVKLRGHRVEPGEIEAVALASGLVDQCMVLPVTDGTRVTSLAAYVVPRFTPFDVTAFANQLAGALPDYLVPAHVVPLTALPLGATGKLDFAALPPAGPHTFVTPTPAPASASAPPTPAPDRAVDARVAAIAAAAAALLGVANVEPDDDLIGLGLDSLGATRLAARLAREFDVEAQVESVLRARTCYTLATTLLARRHTPAGHRGEPVLSDGQIRFWLDDQMRPDRALGNVALLAFRFTGTLAVADLQAALRTVVARHDALHTAVAEADDSGSPVAVPLAVEQALRVDHAVATTTDSHHEARRVAGHLATMVNLSEGPLTVARTVALVDGVLLVLAIHHAAFDGHSVALLASEVSDLLRGEPLPAPPRYSEFSARQAAVLAAAERDRLAQEWADRLRDASDLHWPVIATAAPTATTEHCAEIPVDLPETTWTALYERARRWRVTPYAVALTSYGEALAEVTGIDGFCVASPVNERGPADETTIGLFVTTLPLPAGGYRGETPAAAVARTAATVLDGLNHRTVPLGDILRLLRRRGGKRHPLFQAQFAWQNYPPVIWNIPGIAVTELRIPALAAQHELTLELWPSAGQGGGIVEYDPAVVSTTAAQAVAEAFVRHLDHLCHR